MPAHLTSPFRPPLSLNPPRCPSHVRGNIRRPSRRRLNPHRLARRRSRVRPPHLPLSPPRRPPRLPPERCADAVRSSRSSRSSQRWISTHRRLASMPMARGRYTLVISRSTEQYVCAVSWAQLSNVVLDANVRLAYSSKGQYERHLKSGHPSNSCDGSSADT